jgi:hypothetical protein
VFINVSHRVNKYLLQHTTKEQTKSLYLETSIGVTNMTKKIPAYIICIITLFSQRQLLYKLYKLCSFHYFSSMIVGESTESA